jgi:hypothetical protein
MVGWSSFALSKIIADLGTIDPNTEQFVLDCSLSNQTQSSVWTAVGLRAEITKPHFMQTDESVLAQFVIIGLQLLQQAVLLRTLRSQNVVVGKNVNPGLWFVAVKFNHSTLWMASKNPGRSLSLTAWARSCDVMATTFPFSPFTHCTTSAKSLPQPKHLIGTTKSDDLIPEAGAFFFNSSLFSLTVQQFRAGSLHNIRAYSHIQRSRAGLLHNVWQNILEICKLHKIPEEGTPENADKETRNKDSKKVKGGASLVADLQRPRHTCAACLMLPKYSVNKQMQD